MSRRRITLRTKLLAGFGVVGLLIAALMLLGHHFLREHARRLEATLVAEVRPLVRMNQLQSRLHRVRVLEIELPRMTDYFAVTAHLELLRSEQNAFDSELAQFMREAGTADGGARLGDLHAAWQRYHLDLQAVAALAAAMDMRKLEMLSIFESAVRFKAIERLLQDYAQDIESRARSAREEAVRQQEQQRRTFLLISGAGLMLIAASLLWFARSLVARLSMLHAAARRIAEGEPGVDIAIAGKDELSELARAFDTMRSKVQEREQELRVAYAEQEARVRERTRDLDESNRQLQLLSLAIEQSPVSILITDTAGRIEYVNDTFVQNSGRSREEVLGKTPQMVQPDRIPSALHRQAWDTVRSGRAWDGEFACPRAGGDLVWEHERISPVSDGEGKITHFVVIREDVSLRKQQEEKILFQAQYDHLTQLPNRMLAMDRLSRSISSADRNDARVGLMFIDLDDFKKVNDSLGHDAGDALLVEAARRLRDAVRASDTVARQGGDEFLVIMSDLSKPADAEMVADKVITAFSRPFSVDGNDVVVTPSIGLAIYPDDGDSPGMLLRHADLAMYDAKESGGSTRRFFNKVIHEHATHRLLLERDLRQALENEEFVLHYQPLFTVDGKHVAGAEALLRWNSPTHGQVQPDRFIAVIERNGLIVDVGRWVLRSACRQAAQWRRAGLDDFRIAVNVSPRQFRAGRFLNDVRDALAANGLPPAALQIEVTEGLLIRNAAEVKQILQALDSMGVGIAMDDFGTGYSSLSYLKHFPFHAIKIDREFIRDLALDRDDRALVTAAISMGKELGLKIVAEGVESADQLDILAGLGCDLVQGYYFSRPLPPDLFSRNWLPADAA